MKKICMFLVIVFVISACDSGSGNIKKVKINANEKVMDSFANGSPRIVRMYKESDGQSVFEFEKEYYEDGNLLKEGAIVDNTKDGVWKSYYRSGNLWTEGNFVKGKREGMTKSYQPNGTLKYEGAFKNGEKSGQWNFYNEDGSFEKMINYMQPNTKDTITLELPSQETQAGDH